MNVVMLSFWRNDVGRNLTERAAHLLDKTYHDLEWVWIVGDSTDDTYEALSDLLYGHPRGIGVDLEHIGDTHLEDDVENPRLRAFSRAAQRGLENVMAHHDVVLIHESDIESPPGLVERLLAAPGDVVGAWPTLGPGGPLYDTWAYRGLDGEHFTNAPPHHPTYRADAPFEVASVGTVWRFPAEAVRRGLACTQFGAVELCRGLRQQGYRIWADPRMPVVQPRALWTPQPFPVEVA